MLINQQHCHKHGETKHANGKCTECAREAREAAQARWDALSDAEKMAALLNGVRRQKYPCGYEWPQKLFCPIYRYNHRTGLWEDFR